MMQTHGETVKIEYQLRDYGSQVEMRALSGEFCYCNPGIGGYSRIKVVGTIVS